MDLYHRLLSYYNLTDDLINFRSNLEIDPNLIKDPFLSMKGFSSVIDFLNNAINENKKIVIYGDYDVDGMTSTSILYLALEKRGNKAGYFIPSRYKQGYGLNKDMIDLFYKKGYQVIICLDNGISKFDEVKYARSLDMDVVIIDHHQIIENQLPDTNYIIHQQICSYSNYNVSAAFLAMLTYYGLVGKYDLYICLLAGISIISDMMPLVEDNLRLVKIAINELNSLKYPQFNLLLTNKLKVNYLENQGLYYENNKLINFPFTSKSISYSIVPKLNSLGRIDIGINNNTGVKFLISRNENEIFKSYLYINRVNQNKLDILSTVKKRFENITAKNKVEIFLLEDVEVGLIGLLANYLVNKLLTSCIVFTFSPTDKNLLVGSARSYNGMNLFEIANQLKDKFIEFGGHNYAFGLTIKREDFSKIKEEFILKASTSTNLIELTNYVYLKLEDINPNFDSIYNRFEPFGNQYEEAKFIFEADFSKFVFSKDSKHLLYRLNNNCSINFFNCDFSNFDRQKTYYVSVKYSKSIFNNCFQYSFNIEKIIFDLSNVKIIS